MVKKIRIFLIVCCLFYMRCSPQWNYAETVFESVVIVNTANISDEELPELITRIEDQNPAVIGVNVKIKDEILLSKLSKSTQGSNVVFADYGDSPFLSKYLTNVGSGEILVNNNGLVRMYTNYSKKDGISYPTFTSKIMELFDSEKYVFNVSDFRKNRIRYNGNCANFYRVEPSDIEDVIPELMEGHIVLLGYAGPRWDNTDRACIDSFEDAYRVPAIPKPDNPNMYGTFIMANILFSIMLDSK